MLLKVLDSDGAVKRVKGGWVSTGEPWVYDAERHRRIADAREAEQRAMLAYLDTSGVPAGVPAPPARRPGRRSRCGRCDTCTGTGRGRRPWTPRPQAAAQERISRPGVPVPPRKQWPSGMAELGVPASGRIAAGELADEGRVIGRLSDIGWGTRLRELVTGDDVPVPPEVLDACVKVLAGWDVGGAAGGGGRDRVADPAAPARAPGPADRRDRAAAAAGHRASRSVPARRRRRTPHSGSRRCGTASRFPISTDVDGPVLLVDDVIDSGWTATVVARLLRRAGASAVLPFALALAA